jgi:hypothetical protein
MVPNRRHRPDPSTAERLVTGQIGADDAPPGYRRVAALLGDAGSDFAEPAGPAGAATVSAMAAAIQAAPAPQVPSRRSGMLSKVLAAKTIAIVGVLSLSASGAAAATGHLPDSVQGQVAKVAKHVGVNLPNGKGVARVTEGCTPAGKDSAGNNTFARNRGQYLKQVRATGDAAALAAAEKSRCGMPVQSKGNPGADDSDETPGAENPGKSGEKHGKSGDEHGKSGDVHGQSGDDHGAPADPPAAVETPNPGGIDAGGDTGDAANDTGEANTDPAAGDGSANSDDQPAVEDLPTPAPEVLPDAGS